VPHTIETFQRIQDDTASYSAEQLVPFFTVLDYREDELNALRDWLGEWDTRYDADSPQAFFYAHLWAALLDDIYRDQLPEDITSGGNERQQWATYTLMNAPEHEWWDDIATNTVETRDDILQRSFEGAAAAAIEMGGEDRAAWRWDNVHTNTVIHNPLGQSGTTLIENMFNRGPFRTYGTDGSLKNMRWDAADGLGVSGSVVSQRFIVDFSDFSNSVSIIPTGQSGHPFSAYYDDQIAN
jgi:penicillin G amidase